jgi:hypothetical protein
MNIKNAIFVVLGILCIFAGFLLVKDYIIPFFKVFLGMLLIFIGIGFIFTRTMSAVRYRVR